MNNKQRSICLLLLVGSILLVVAGWNMPEKPVAQIAP
jgi:hypothetical protein